MKSARSLSRLLVSGAAVAALVSSCTIETRSGDSKGGSSSGTTGGNSGTTGGSESATGGTSANTGGSSGTTGGSSATTGGNTATTGGGSSDAAGSGGEETIGGGAGGMGGDAGGQGGASFDDCDTCLDAKCTNELDACLDDPVCFTGDIDNPGQYEQVVRCVDTIRLTRPVKRADLRDCGNSVGSSLSTLWPPEEMSVATVDLINCMATGVANESGNSAWANSSNIMNVWAPGSCAKLACTAVLP